MKKEEGWLRHLLGRSGGGLATPWQKKIKMMGFTYCEWPIYFQGPKPIKKKINKKLEGLPWGWQNHLQGPKLIKKYLESLLMG
jgi:hypothetical protein